MSAGFCQKPECNREVVVELISGKCATLGEMAHIVAAAEDGPRSDADADEDALVHVDNLILLCPTCHTLVDKYPEQFGSEEIVGWKLRHALRRRSLFGVSRHETRLGLS